jgi:uroporphyrinogen III methyltransferase/synthase
MSSLRGRRILITRARQQAGDLAQALAERGAVPIVFPTIEIAPPDDYTPLDNALKQLPGYDWLVFTSVNGVAAFCDRLAAAGLDAGTLRGRRTAAIGPATARALSQRGVQAELVPDEYVAEAIVDGLGEVVGQWILLPRAEVAREALAEELGRRGAVVHEIPVYRTLPARPDGAALAELHQGLDVLTFASASAVHNFVVLLSQAGLSISRLLGRAQVACIGPITAQAARELGLPVHVQAQQYTLAGLVQALEQHFTQLGPGAAEN